MSEKWFIDNIVLNTMGFVKQRFLKQNTPSENP